MPHRSRLLNSDLASQSEIKRLARRVGKREVLCLRNVHEEAVHGLIQILQSMGANLRVEIADPNSPRLFRRTPRRK